MFDPSDNVIETQDLLDRIGEEVLISVRSEAGLTASHHHDAAALCHRSAIDQANWYRLIIYDIIAPEADQAFAHY